MKKRAFTLAELLTAVLVISIIMVALAPVITKRMRDTITLENSDKEGLQVYINPGDYVFNVPVGIDTLFIQGAGGGGGGGGATYAQASAGFANSRRWEVPKGVNKVTITITGAGGGGGSGFARTASDICKGGTGYHLAVADNGKDLCVSGAENPSNQSVWGEITTVDSGTPFTCASYTCCWSNVVGNSTLGSCSGNGCNRTVCTYPAAVGWCSTYNSSAGDSFPNNSHIDRSARLLTKDEAQRILNNGDIGNGTNKWDICMQELSCSGGSATGNINTNNIDKCPMGKQGSADGSANGYAYPESVWLANRYRFNAQTCNVPFINTDTYDQRYAFSVFCAYELNNWYQYSGAGGASGPTLVKEINVLPGDILDVTIGSGGAGGSGGSNGRQGGDTIVTHTRQVNGVTKPLGTYTVKGGLGGKAATGSANGAEYTNSELATNDFCKSETWDIEGNHGPESNRCESNPKTGKSGTETEGGIGATIAENAKVANGGKLTEKMGTEGKNEAKGETATATNGYGSGGGGGTCARGVRVPSQCSGGGNGSNGYVSIKYNLAFPGGGGGSAGRVTGATGEKLHEVKYSVTEGSKVHIKVGYGGTGGTAGQDGFNGTASVVGNNDVVFYGGEGGKTATDQYITAQVPRSLGGSSANIDENGRVIQSGSIGVRLNSAKTSYTFSPVPASFLGQDGGIGPAPETSNGYSGYNTSVFRYGFSGGMGGSPYDLTSESIQENITCSGGPSGSLGTGVSYLCSNGTVKGSSGKIHSAEENRYGGAGGGGGGVLSDFTEYGAGGNGSSGYLRIRWNAAEQNQ